MKRVLLADNPRFSKKHRLQIVYFESAFDVFNVFIITDMSVEGDRGVDHSGCEALKPTLDGSRKVGGS